MKKNWILQNCMYFLKHVKKRKITVKCRKYTKNIYWHGKKLYCTVYFSLPVNVRFFYKISIFSLFLKYCKNNIYPYYIYIFTQSIYNLFFTVYIPSLELMGRSHLDCCYISSHEIWHIWLFVFIASCISPYI